MKVTTISQSFVRFLRQPTWENLQRVRQLVILLPTYRPYATDWQEAQQRFGQSDFAGALRLALTMRESMSLCPRWHFLVGVSAQEVGDVALSTHERRIVQACLRGLLDSGDGTLERPFVVTYPSDAYDILQALGEEPVSQRTVARDDLQPALSHRLWLDFVLCRSGAEIAFDVTAMLEHAADARGSGAVSAGNAWSDPFEHSLARTARGGRSRTRAN